MEESTYLLKHRDTDVAEFRLDKYSNNVDYIKIFDETFSPVNTKAGDTAKAVSLNSWLYNRCIPNSRSGAARVKKIYNVENLRDAMLLKHGLSLSDHFWIDHKPFNLKWKNINLFKNRYDTALGEILFDRKLKLVERTEGSNPDVSTGGLLKKRWEYNDSENKSYLIKGGSGEKRQEPFNEYFASILFEKLGFEHVPYLVRYEHGEWVSVCPCIADEKTEMVSAEDLRRKYGIAERYEDIVRLAETKNCASFKDSVDKMIIADYIIGNTDRHWNNFGILRDAESGTWNGLIPLYDNGYSLWNNDYVRNDIPVKNLSFDEYNEDSIRRVNISRHVKDVPNLTAVFDAAFKEYGNTSRKEELRGGIEARQREVENLIKEGIRSLGITRDVPKDS